MAGTKINNTCRSTALLNRNDRVTGSYERPTRRLLFLRNLLLAMAGAAYLGIGYFATTTPHPPLVTVLIALTPLGAAGLAITWKARARMLLLSLYVAGALAVVTNLDHLRDHTAWLYFSQHAGAMTLLGLTFGSTLGNNHADALCSRIASFIIAGPLDEGYLRYTWKVTLAWTIYFAASAILSALLFFLAPIEVWSVFANFLTPVSLIIMFVGEYMIRQRALPHGPRLSVTDTIQAYQKYNQRQNPP